MGDTAAETWIAGRWCLLFRGKSFPIPGIWSPVFYVLGSAFSLSGQGRSGFTPVPSELWGSDSLHCMACSPYPNCVTFSPLSIPCLCTGHLSTFKETWGFKASMGLGMEESLPISSATQISRVSQSTKRYCVFQMQNAECHDKGPSWAKLPRQAAYARRARERRRAYHLHLLAPSFHL